MKTYAVYLWPRGSLASDLGSDTLFGALCWAIRVLDLDDVGQMLVQFDPPRFAFSSTFPVYRAGDAILRFYPRPIWLELNPDQVERLAQKEQKQRSRLTPTAAKVEIVERAKSLKGAAYVSEALFGELASGGLDAEGVMLRLKTSGSNPTDIERAGSTLMTRAERVRVKHRQNEMPESLMQPVAVQHNQIDRVAGATAEGLLFYANETHFAPGAGLWCLLRVKDETVKKSLIDPALRYLADTGLGGNRTAGKGHFQIEVADAPALPDPGPAANGWLTLSRYLPVEGEWTSEGRPLAYRLTNLWARREKRYAHLIHSESRSEPIYKRLVRVFEPGSVFPLTEWKEVYGKLAPVVPQEDQGWAVYQSGLAIGVPVRAP